MKTKALLLFPVLALTTFWAQAEKPSIDVQACSIAELDTPPIVKDQSAPIYPGELKQAHVTGEATIHFIVDLDGKTIDVSCVNSTQPAFADAAIAAVRQWHFQPATKGGKVVRCWMDAPMGFIL